MDYDTRFEYDYSNPSDYGWVHEDEIPDLNHTRDMIHQLMKAVYVTGNMDDLENSLDELAHCFDMRIPETDPVLQKKDKDKILLNSFSRFTQKFTEKAIQEGIKNGTC